MNRGQRWTKGARRIQCRSRERTTEERLRGDGQSDREPRNLVEDAARVDASGKGNEDQEEGHNSFEEHAARARNAAGQVRSAEMHRRPNIARDKSPKGIRLNLSTTELYGPKREPI